MLMVTTATFMEHLVCVECFKDTMLLNPYRNTKDKSITSPIL